MFEQRERYLEINKMLQTFVLFFFLNACIVKDQVYAADFKIILDFARINKCLKLFLSIRKMIQRRV